MESLAEVIPYTSPVRDAAMIITLPSQVALSQVATILILLVECRTEEELLA
jgi:hypothetical protein